MSPRLLRLAALGALVLGLPQGGAPSFGGETRSPAHPRSKPCTGPAVALDPDRFACAARRTTSDPHEVPLPKRLGAPQQDDDGIDIADGVSLQVQLGPRDTSGEAGRSLDGITTKRTAIVPRTEEPGLGKTLMHGASDGVGVGLNFDFESR